MILEDLAAALDQIFFSFLFLYIGWVFFYYITQI